MMQSLTDVLQMTNGCPEKELIKSHMLDLNWVTLQKATGNCNYYNMSLYLTDEISQSSSVQQENKLLDIKVGSPVVNHFKRKNSGVM